VGVGVGVGSGHTSSKHPSANAGEACIGSNKSNVAAVKAADTTKRDLRFAMVSARTACRWGRCRHRPEA
jgi:hypothetical protein